ncbi:ComEC/Rec2 family competence protein [Chroococcidiopsis sp. CCMEE 29]|uniref:ComEC/Rec2 family competence protein n=1 Tax=Chroococcidiopsis sp. CCMEE 29 TaxID=155894 RepID=UPI0020205F42|nr:ComEC/Rec2 family competence protein [Chroococcidiopsis sp. CCMEE 29]
MTQTSGVIFCLAYILGLLSTAVAWGGYGILALSIGTAIFLKFRGWKGYEYAPLTKLRRVKSQFWLIAGLVGFLATLYFQARIPQLAVNDVSKFIPSTNVRTQEKVVQGKVASTPRITRNQQGQFWLEATHLHIRDGTASVSKEVIGKLYVTVPLLQTTGLQQNQAIAVTGALYKPKPAANRGAFDFQAYLAQEGSFAGLKGRQVSLLNPEQSPSWGWWTVRRRIIRSQVHWLDVPEGPLVSAMVLGNRVVDVPFSISDAFVRVGLAHALAASGFQVSLILGLILALTRRFSRHVQFCLGVTALLIFGGLAGPQPSVLRAVFMGTGVLTALVVQRKVKPLGLLLLAATVLLLFNPMWIWNLGFQFSFLATLGLVVTVPPIMKRLDWMPPAIASLIAVPIAAYVWTLPLQLYTFGLVSPYSIVVNVITTIPLSVISIGAFISAIAAVISPTVGSALAWLLYYPTHTLIAVVEFFGQLPGATVAVGTISAPQLIALYGLLGLVCLLDSWQRRWWVASLMALGLVLIPVWQTQATVFRVTALAGSEPILVIQDHGKVLLVNSGNANTARFTVLPFLQQRGVNQINWAIATNSHSKSNNGWLEVMQSLPVKSFHAHSNPQGKVLEAVIQSRVQVHHGRYEVLSAGQTVTAGSTAIKLIDTQAPIWQLQTQGLTWLIMDNLNPNKQKQLALTRLLPHAQVLWWSGEPLDMAFVEAVKPEVAIAASASLDNKTMSALRKRKAQVFLTRRDGAIQWTPGGKFEVTIEAMENDTSRL